MPYKNIKDLPERIKDNLPKHAQEIYRKSFNNAWKQYKDPKKERGMLAGKKCLIKLLGQR